MNPRKHRNPTSKESAIQQKKSRETKQRNSDAKKRAEKEKAKKNRPVSDFFSGHNKSKPDGLIMQQIKTVLKMTVLASLKVQTKYLRTMQLLITQVEMAAPPLAKQQMMPIHQIMKRWLLH